MPNHPGLRHRSRPSVECLEPRTLLTGGYSYPDREPTPATYAVAVGYPSAREDEPAGHLPSSATAGSYPEDGDDEPASDREPEDDPAPSTATAPPPSPHPSVIVGRSGTQDGSASLTLVTKGSALVAYPAANPDFAASPIAVSEDRAPVVFSQNDPALRRAAESDADPHQRGRPRLPSNQAVPAGRATIPDAHATGERRDFERPHPAGLIDAVRSFDRGKLENALRRFFARVGEAEPGRGEWRVLSSGGGPMGLLAVTCVVLYLAGRGPMGVRGLRGPRGRDDGVALHQPGFPGLPPL